jgi:hypothetical protein
LKDRDNSGRLPCSVGRFSCSFSATTAASTAAAGDKTAAAATTAEAAPDKTAAARMSAAAPATTACSHFRKYYSSSRCWDWNKRCKGSCNNSSSFKRT